MDPQRDREPFFNFYKNAVGYMDDLLGRFLDRIDLSRNLVLIVADHGESFWDDGGITHGGRMSRILMSVPCVFIGVGVSVGKITVPTQHVDLLPTLLHLAQGGPVPVKHLQGRDLLADRLPPRKILLACPADDRRDAETFMVLRPNMALKLSWSHVRRDLEFDATVDNNGKSFSYQIPPTPTAVRWASQIARILKPCVR